MIFWKWISGNTKNLISSIEPVGPSAAAAKDESSRIMRHFFPHFLIAAAILGTVPVQAGDDGLLARLRSQAPGLDRQVLRLALDALRCAQADGMSAVERLAVIDYSRPSTEARLWVFDLGQARLLFREHVAHGRNSGDNFSKVFSNEPESRQTSLGLFRTADAYDGRNGYSLRMDGLEPGVNDKARERAIVMHGADYVDDGMIDKFGRLGRSWGCPAVRMGIVRPMIDALKGGQLLFAYYPDSQWLKSSRFLNCQMQVAAR
jgi:hypothetical protein